LPYIAPCFVNGLEAFDGEVNLAFDENLISNEFAVKLCLDYEVKKGKKLVKKELIVALKGELYFVKFIINPEEDDFEPGVILGRSFLRLAQGVVNFGNRVIIIYSEPDPFEEESKKTGKSSDDWDQLLDFNFDDVPKSGEELPPFVCKMGKSNRNKKRAMDNLNLFYQDIGPSSSAGRHITQEEVAKEELEIRISQIYALLEEERPVIETMAYNDKYKKILDEIWKDKVELDGKTVKEDEEAVKRIKGEALKEKDDPGAFIFPIRLEGKVKENALADTGSDINTMPYRIFETLGREDMKKEHMTEKSDHHDPNAQDNMKQWKRYCFHKFTTSSCYEKDVTEMKSLEIDDMLRIRVREAESEEEIFNSVAWIRAFNINEPIYAELCHRFYSTYEFDEVCTNDELQSKKIIKFRLGGRAHNLTLLEFARRLGLYQAIGLEKDDFNVYFKGGLRNDDNFNAQNYWTTWYDKVQKNDLWLLSMFDARHQNGYANVAWVIAKWMKRKGDGTQKESHMDLNTTTLRDLIDSNGKLIPKDPQPGVPRVGIPRPPRASMQD
ncbi:hypothetical protein Tco_0751978, partial [Tanacetum coccineum]